MEAAVPEMENNFTAVDGHIEEYRMLSLHQTPDSSLNNARHSLKELQKALNVIPKDLSNPDMDWGLLKILYGQKDEAHEKAAAELKKVEYILDVVDREVDRCKNNLSALDRDMRIIKTPRTKQQYSETINIYAQQYKKAVEQRKQTALILTALKAAIRESNSRQFPRDHAAALPGNRSVPARAEKKMPAVNSANQPKVPGAMSNQGAAGSPQKVEPHAIVRR